MAWEAKHEEYVEVPENEFIRAELMELETKTINYTDKKTGKPDSFDKLMWKFEFLDPPYAGLPVRGETRAELSDHPNNQFRQWAEALIGREITPGMVLSESDLIGLRALVMIRYEDDYKDPEKKWRRVADVLPIEGGDGPPF